MSKFFYRDKPVVGLDFSQTSLKAMSIDPKRDSVLGYGSIDLDPAKVQEVFESGDSTYLSASLAKLLREKIIGHISSNHMVMSIPTPRTYTRSFILPADAEGHLHDAIALEAEQYIPVPVSQLYIDYEVIERKKDTISVLLCAVPQRIVDICTDAARKVGLRVVMIEPSISAVARLLTHTEEGHLPTVIVDIGPANTDIAILDGAVRVTGGIAIGGNTFTIDIARRLKIPLENAHQLKVLHGLNAGPRQAEIVTALEPNLKRSIAEVKKVVRYFTERIDPEKKLEQVIIVGGGSNIPGLGDYFTNVLIMPARIASPWQVLDFSELSQPSRQFKPRYITVAGLASVDPKRVLA
jgi:type IV pilus assembly protein PilM